MSQFNFKKIVVPIDFSDDSDAALRRTLDSTTQANDVHAVYVLSDLPMTEPGVMWDELTFEKREAEARKTYASRYAGAEYARVKFTVLEGDPGSQIADYASRIHADLIVMPSHGRRGIERLFLGSVSERTIRLAHCAVLVLRK